MVGKPCNPEQSLENAVNHLKHELTLCNFSHKNEHKNVTVCLTTVSETQFKQPPFPPSCLRQVKNPFVA